MRTLVSFASLLWLALVLSTSGCGDSCEDLAEICARCTDATYKASCDKLVSNSVQGVCSGQAATFNQACPFVFDDTTAVTTSTGATTSGAGGATATSSTATTSSAGGSTTTSSAGGAGTGGTKATGGAGGI